MLNRNRFPFFSSILFAVTSFLCSTSTVFAQAPAVDFTHGEIKLHLLPDSSMVTGVVEYTFQVLRNSDSLMVDARQMEIMEVMLNGRSHDFSFDGKRAGISIRRLVPAEHRLTISYKAKPTKALYFLGWKDELDGNEQIWTQGQGQNNSHWVPSFEDLSQKMTYTFQIKAPVGYTLLSNGVLNKEKSKPALGEWTYEQKQPISAYLLALALGKYKEYQLLGKGGIPLFQYLYPSDSTLYRNTYGSTLKVFEILEEEIGIPYPFDNYKEVPVFDFLYAGMENASCTIFSDQFVTDSHVFSEEEYLRVQAHELAHQWWGNLVTEKSGSDHWLHEGFATYYAQQVERRIRGEEWYDWYMLGKALQLEKAESQSLLDSAASSLTFYEKGAWALTMLKNQLGDEGFKTGLSRVLKKYRFRNISVQDFLSEIPWASTEEQNAFEAEWLASEIFPMTSVEAWLKRRNSKVKTFLALRSQLESEVDSMQRLDKLIKSWNEHHEPEIRYFLLLQYPKMLPDEMLLQALQKTDSSGREYEARLRRELINAIELIPEDFFLLFKSQLSDVDLVIREVALVRLWLQFPEKRKEILQASFGPRQRGDDRFVITRTALGLLSEEEIKEAQLLYNSLLEFLKSDKNGDTRLYASTTLISILPDPPEVLLETLIELSIHHRWQIRTQAGRVLLNQLGNKEVRTWYEKALPKRSEREQKRLAELLELSKSQP